jgi:putative tryptophan/tyrosine transport system substrate-binding protein
MSFDHLKRREFVTLLGGAAVWPVVARAQQVAMPVVGVLWTAGPLQRPENKAAFIRGLAETGYIEGRNVAIEYRWANNEPDRLPELAADLVRRGVAVIAAPGSTPAALAAKAATSTIPIAFSMGRDPVQVGAVASLTRPGGNITGFSEMNTEVVPKRLGLLHALVPKAARIAMLFDPRIAGADGSIKEAQDASATIGLPIEILTATTKDEIDAALATLAQKRVDALYVSGGGLLLTGRAQIIAFTARHAIPAIYDNREFMDAGGLMSYGSNVADSFRQAGIYTGRILKGEKPADMPVQQPTKFELVINLKTAKALGLTIPPSLLAIADEVIE